MKVTLTPNITRYDNKMRFRMNKRTAKILALSAAIGTATGILLSPLLPSLYAVCAGVAIGLAVTAVLITEIDGIPMFRVLILHIRAAFYPDRMSYRYIDCDPEWRLSLNERTEAYETPKNQRKR